MIGFLWGNIRADGGRHRWWWTLERGGMAECSVCVCVCVCVLACDSHAQPCFCSDEVRTGQMGYRWWKWAESVLWNTERRRWERRRRGGGEEERRRRKKSWGQHTGSLRGDAGKSQMHHGVFQLRGLAVWSGLVLRGRFPKTQRAYTRVSTTIYATI